MPADVVRTTRHNKSRVVSAIEISTSDVPYRTQGGIFTTPGDAYTTPVDMWVKALGELILLAIQTAFVDLGRNLMRDVLKPPLLALLPLVHLFFKLLLYTIFLCNPYHRFFT